jgi:hypothetical protein
MAIKAMTGRLEVSETIKLTLIQLSTRIVSSGNSRRQLADGVASHITASYHSDTTLIQIQIKVKPMHT